jgi:serine/threonine protein kinase
VISYLYAESITDSEQARVVACKRYRNEKPKEDFEQEQKTLDYLKESLRGDTRILVHIASIVHGNEFMILLPLAAHGDLEIFLRRGRQPQADTSLFTDIYNFNQTFSKLSEDTLHESLLEQLLGLSSALVYLHEELRILGATNRYCAHMDLKPENILIDEHDESRVGKWMISDFGISLFDKRTNQTEATLSSVRDVGRRLTSRAPRAQVIRGHGSYQPPEVDDTDVDARKCDVWSFGAILCDVLIFSFESNGGLSLEQFRSNRSHGGDDFFYMKQGNATILKPSIMSWLDANYNRPPVAWMRDCVTMLRKVFITNPTQRCGIREVSHGLERLLNPPQDASPTTQLLPAIQETSSIEHTRSNGRMNGGHLSVPNADRPNAHVHLPRDQTISQQYSPPLNAAPHRFADLAPLRQHHSPPMQQHEWQVPVESPTQLQLPFRAPVEQSVAESQSLSYGFAWPAQLENIPKHTRSRDSGQGSISSSSVHSGPSIEGSMRRDSSLTPKDFTYFTPRPKITLGLKESPQAVAISPSGDFVAFLFAQDVLTVSIEHDHRPQFSLTSNAKWKRLCIAEPYSAVYGVKSNGQKCVSHDNAGFPNDNKPTIFRSNYIT